MSEPKWDKEIEALVHLGLAQGWKVDPLPGGKLAWKGPNGEGPVFTPLRVVGRGKNNVTSQLARAGLDVSSLKNAPHPKGTSVPLPQMTMADMADEHGAPRIAATVRELSVLPDGGFDQLMSDFISDCAGALTSFMDRGNLVPADKDDPRVTEAEKLYLEAEEHNAELRHLNGEYEKKIADLKVQIEKACRERDEHKTREAAALERAVTAENKLAMLRSALREE